MSVPVPEEVARQARAAGPWESPWIWLTCVALVVACVGLTVLVRRRRAARRCGIAVNVVLLLLATLTAVNSHVGYVRSATDLVLLLQRGGGPLRDLGRVFEQHGSMPGTRQIRLGGPDGPLVERLVIADPGHGVASGRNFVLLPPGYTDAATAHRRYPVVYLVHGNPGGPEDWLAAGDAPGTLRRFSRLRALPPMIVVSVDLTAGHSGRDWEGLDVPGGPKLESYLTRSVVPVIDRRYRTRPPRARRHVRRRVRGPEHRPAPPRRVRRPAAGHAVRRPGQPAPARRRPGSARREHAAGLPAPCRSRSRSPPSSRPVRELPATSRGPAASRGAFRARGQQATVRTEEGFGHTWRTARASLPYLLAFAAGRFEQAQR